VGSLDESFSSAILSGVPFILIDNFRGRVNSQILESALRGIGQANVRVPHKGEMQLPTTYLNWMLSSNGIEGGNDFANRTIVTGIRKHAEGYKFREYPGGRDILGIVKANQERYLGAVFAVIMEWDRAGRQRTGERRHEFREWAQTLDWIVQEIFRLPPLCDGHTEEVLRMSNPALTWLRLVAISVEQEGRLGTELSAEEIVELCENEGIEIPGVSDPYFANTMTGKALKKAFASAQEVSFDYYKVSRGTITDKNYKQKPVYRFGLRVP
jgi:hypothetical protein